MWPKPCLCLGLGSYEQALHLEKCPTQEAQEVTSLLKPTKALSSHPNRSIAPLGSIKIRQPEKKGNLKQFAREKGQQDQDPKIHVPEKLNGSKRIGRLDFSNEEDIGKPKKKLCDT